MQKYDNASLQICLFIIPLFSKYENAFLRCGYLYALLFAKEEVRPLNAGPRVTPVKLFLFASLGVKTRSGKDGFLVFL